MIVRLRLSTCSFRVMLLLTLIPLLQQMLLLTLSASSNTNTNVPSKNSAPAISKSKTKKAWINSISVIQRTGKALPKSKTSAFFKELHNNKLKQEYSNLAQSNFNNSQQINV